MASDFIFQHRWYVPLEMAVKATQHIPWVVELLQETTLIGALVQDLNLVRVEWLFVTRGSLMNNQVVPWTSRLVLILWLGVKSKPILSWFSLLELLELYRHLLGFVNFVVCLLLEILRPLPLKLLNKYFRVLFFNSSGHPFLIEISLESIKLKWSCFVWTWAAFSLFLYSIDFFGVWNAQF